MIRCLCGKDSIPLSNKKYRPSVADEDVDLKSLDQFLSSLHFDWERETSHPM
jgi:hypothetical protein